jgi:glyoxylase-like metal-dependent hydrolase (beta-lactamase superfamily II)
LISGIKSSRETGGGRVDLVEMDNRISPEVHLTPSPGHTPGHVSVVIESEGQRAVITGDINHHPCQLVHPAWATNFDSDIPAATATGPRI